MDNVRNRKLLSVLFILGFLIVIAVGNNVAQETTNDGGASSEETEEPQSEPNVITEPEMDEVNPTSPPTEVVIDTPTSVPPTVTSTLSPTTDNSTEDESVDDPPSSETEETQSEVPVSDPVSSTAPEEMVTDEVPTPLPEPEAEATEESNAVDSENPLPTAIPTDDESENPLPTVIVVPVDDEGDGAIEEAEIQEPPLEEFIVEPSLALVFTENFDDRALPSWHLESGSINIVSTNEDNRLQLLDGNTAIKLNQNQLHNFVAQVDFSATNGTLALTSNNVASGENFGVSVSIGGEVQILRDSNVIEATNIGQLDALGWHSLRVSFVDANLLVTVDDNRVLIFENSSLFSMESVQVSRPDANAGDGIFILDNFELWVPDEQLESYISNNQEASLTEPVSNESESSIVPEVTAEPDPVDDVIVDAESVLALSHVETFDSEYPVNWVLRPGWMTIDDNGNGRLAVGNSDASATFGYTPYADVGVRLIFKLDSGAFHVRLRDTGDHYYEAIIYSNGLVQINRDAQSMTSSQITPLDGGWHSLSLDAVGSTISLMVDDSPAIEVVDSDPLPAGQITLIAPDTIIVDETSDVANMVLVDNFELWLDNSNMSSQASSIIIGDYVWADLDADGIQDVNEPGVADVEIQLHQIDARKNPVAVAYTDVNGYYSFSPDPGTYFLTITIPDGYDLTSPYATISTLDSDFMQYSGRTGANYLLTDGAFNFGIDAGLVQLYQCDADIDIVLAIDGSGSISVAEFNLIKSFSRGLAQSFAFEKNSPTEMSIVQFAGTNDVALHSKLTNKQSSILSAIDSMSQLGGLTDLEGGIHFAQAQLDQDGRPQPTSHAIILLTDGDDTTGSDPIYAAALAKYKGTEVFVVAVGATADDITYTINPVASDPDSDRVFEVDGLEDLVSTLYELAGQTCNTPARGIPLLLAPKDKSLVTVAFLTWKPVAGTTNYHIQVDDDKKFGSPVEATFSLSDPQTSGVVFTGDDGVWYWRVRAVVGGLPGEFSDVFSFTYDGTPPATPILAEPFSGATESSSGVKFKWEKVPDRDVDHYELEYWTDGDVFSTVENVGKKTTYSAKNPFLADDYYWRVRAVDKAGNVSDWSEIFLLHLVTPVKGKGGEPVLFRFTTSTPVLTWGNVTWATDYEIQVDNDPKFKDPTYTYRVDSTELEKQIDPLPDGIWYWRIRARASDGKWANYGSTNTFAIDT